MKILKYLLIIGLIFSFSLQAHAWRWGSSWNQNDLDIQRNALIMDEVPATPGNPGTNKMKMYAKDNGSGSTRIYALDSAGTEVDILTSQTGAPIDATYIVQTANNNLSSEQALGALATGIVKNATTTGVLSIAVADTDYLVTKAVDIITTAPLTINGTTNLDNIIAGADADITFAVTSASTTVTGVAELAIASELNTGTDATRANTPDALAGSIFGTKIVVLKVFDDDVSVFTGDGKIYFTIPEELNGMNLVSVGAHIYTVSSSGVLSVAVHNNTDSADMLSVNITIDETESDSKDATTPATIDTSTDDVATGDEIRIDCDSEGTGAKGLEARLSFRLP